MQNTIDFFEILQGDQPFHIVRTTHESPPRLSAIDLVTVACQINNNMAAKALARVSEDGAANYGAYKFPGLGQKAMPVVDVNQAIELIMELPGKMANRNRKNMLMIIHRYFAIL